MGGCPDLTPQFANWPRVKRAVGVCGGLGAGKAADVHGGNQLRLPPTAIIKSHFTPLVGELTRIEEFERDSTHRVLVVAP